MFRVSCTARGFQLSDGFSDLAKQRPRLVQGGPRKAAEGHRLRLDSHRPDGLHDVLRIADGIQGAPDHARKLAPGTLLEVERLDDLLGARSCSTTAQELILPRLLLECLARGVPNVASLLFKDLAKVLESLLLVGGRRSLERACLSNLTPARKEDEEVFVRLVDQLQVVEAHLISLQVHLEKQCVALQPLLLCKDLVLATHGIGFVHRDRSRLCVGLHLLQLPPGVRIDVRHRGGGCCQRRRRHGNLQAGGRQDLGHATRALA
mmetsp:Transcript_24606/g.58408  ORF Transcript_24606/g.58408 Transcript_24606/m.58408 type:complete len:263 (+) Transcript_24606:1214-2002(+)